MAKNIALSERTAKVLFISLEISKEQISSRFASLLTDISLSGIVHQQILSASKNETISKIENFKDILVIVCAYNFITIPSMKNKIKQIKKIFDEKIKKLFVKLFFYILQIKINSCLL